MAEDAAGEPPREAYRPMGVEESVISLSILVIGSVCLIQPYSMI